MQKYIKTAHLALLEKTNGGLIALLPEVFLKVFILIPLLLLWQNAITLGAKTPYSLQQILTYTYASALLTDFLVVKTVATGWLSEGVLQKLYGRPLSVLGQLVALSFGSWLPNLLLFSLPMALLAPVFSIRLIPYSLWFFPSLFLCVSLGFAIDFLFACLSLRLNNITWLIHRIRAGIMALFSGSFIPIALLPFGLDKIFIYQPFSSLAGAPLSILVGAGNIKETLLLQVFWNMILWPLALYVFRLSQERMVSYGG